MPSSVASSREEKRFLTEYCDNSTIHGVRYLGELSRPFIERIFWGIILFISLLLCAKLTWQVLEKWENHPVILSFADRSSSLGTIPFPAITLCPANQINSSVFRFSPKVDELYDDPKDFPKYSPKEWEFTETIFNICSETLFRSLLFPNITLEKTTVGNLVELNNDFESSFEKCYWKGNPKDCRKLWTKSVTASGICYTFNALGSELILREESVHEDYIIEESQKGVINWDPEIGYTKSGSDMYPRRILSAGFEMGLSLDLISDGRDDEIYCGVIPGFVMVFHTPHEIPQSLRNFVRIPTGQETLLAVQPNIRATTENLRSYSPQKRQCYFSNEKYLRYFKLYSEYNCELECLGNYSLKICGCVAFYMPRNIHTPVCRPHKGVCLEEAYKVMVLNEIEEGDCDCLPSCNTLSYDMEVSQSAMSDVRYENNTNIQRSSVTVFFKEDQFWSSVRAELYGSTEVVANCGGILGLLMGVSVVSVIELCYFILIHVTKKIKTKLFN